MPAPTSIPAAELQSLNRQVEAFNAAFTPGEYVTASGAHTQLLGTAFIWFSRGAWRAAVMTQVATGPVPLEYIRATPVQEPT